jgi:hypothetical protein
MILSKLNIFNTVDKNTSRKVVILLITVLLSFFTASFFRFFRRDGYYSDSPILLIFPGIFFSLYVIWLNFKSLSYKIAIKYFVIMIISYTILVYISMMTYGLITPIAGGLAANLIKRFFYNGALTTKNKFSTIGIVSGIIGLATFWLFVYLNNDGGEGIGFGFLIAAWQIPIGIRCIYNNQLQTIA